MSPPRVFLNHPAKAAEVLARFSTPTQTSETSYATVRDYCESVDHLPQITGLDGDLKNVQRPWAVKTILRTVPPPARLLEIGGGEPSPCKRSRLRLNASRWAGVAQEACELDSPRANSNFS